MTKKSVGRMQRDAEKKLTTEKGVSAASDIQSNNTCWDDLNSMYSSMCQLLCSHTALSEFTNNAELMSAVINKELLISNINILSNDLNSMNIELINIHDMHKNMSGGTKDPDMLMYSIGIFEHYNLFMEKHDAVILPTAYSIIAQLDEAEKLLMAADKINSELTDPNVISDIDYVETPHNDLHIKFGSEYTATVRNDNVDIEKLQQSFNEIHAEPIKIVLVDKPVNSIEVTE